MIIKDLIAQLSTFNPDAPVRVFQDIGGAFDVEQVLVFSICETINKIDTIDPVNIVVDRCGAVLSDDMTRKLLDQLGWKGKPSL
jgi:hypothetical protein